MPELPEIETIIRSLKPLAGLRIEHLEVINPVVLRCQEFPPEDVKGKTIVDITRRGKFIVIETREGLALVVHLGMSGRFYLANSRTPRAKHTHAVLLLQNGQELRYHDPRRFGGLWLTRDSCRVVSRLGIEPLDSGLTVEYLSEMLGRRKTAIKNLLLNQKVIAGIGNIYADEILHRAGIKPDRLANSLSPAEINSLHQAIVHTLELGIAHRGTTFRDYRDGLNLPGGFQNLLQVYGREGHPCPTCGQPISRIVIGGRSSHYCPCCQQ